MPEEPAGGTGKDRLDVLVEQIVGRRGRVLAVELSGEDASELVTRLDIALDDARGGAEVRMVLGAACTTAAKAIEQFTSALQLPYQASRGWTDFLERLGDRPVSVRQCVIVSDACRLLAYEDCDRWQELVSDLHGGPYCMGGGWSTLILADHRTGWEHWTFGEAVRDARRDAVGPFILWAAHFGATWNSDPVS